MNKIMINILKSLRRIYLLSNPEQASQRNWKIFSNKQYANELIYNYLKVDNPCMIGRFGANEMLCLANYLGVKQNKYKTIIGYIEGKTPAWWWEKKIMDNLHLFAGFFPNKIDYIEKFCELMLNDITEIDILGSWLKQERFIQDKIINAKQVVLEDIEPFFTSNPWTLALQGKKVLVVHPFTTTIEKQFAKRKLLFDNSLLPEFELKTIKAVQSIAGQKTKYKDWFEALIAMEEKIEATAYDICIIGAGAYGLPLAAFVKRSGKKAIHLGGVTQLLFGIKGKRWEEFIVWPYRNLYNEHWVRPREDEKPKNASKVEGACYW
jgi:hypothetical protein